MKTLVLFQVLICILQVEAQSDGDVRLVDGVTRSSGRIELYYRGEWGFVCDDGFNRNASNVACRSAGFSDARPTYFSHYNYLHTGEMTNRILLDEVRCRGTENNLLQCRHRPIGANDCDYSENVGVACYGLDLGNSIELQGAGGPNEAGILVLNHDGVSGTVCFDHNWDEAGLRVACRMLGHTESNSRPLTVNSSFYGGDTGMPVLMAGVNCRGDEIDLSECNYRGLYELELSSATCPPGNEIAIDCLAGNRNPEVTLINRNGTYGELQLTYNRFTGPVCSSGMSSRTAHVYCRMLGYGGHNGELVTFVERNTTGFLYHPECRGFETNILDCRYRYPLSIGQCIASPAIACIRN